MRAMDEDTRVFFFFFSSSKVDVRICLSTCDMLKNGVLDYSCKLLTKFLKIVGIVLLHFAFKICNH